MARAARSNTAPDRRPSRRWTSICGTDLQLTFEQALHGTSVEMKLSQADGGRQTVTVKVPPGVADGQTIRVRGKGHSQTDGRTGDVLITCRVGAHPWFRRDGADILLDVPLTIIEATLGARIDVPTIDGTTTVTIPPGTPSGTKLRLKGKGRRDEQHGHAGRSVPGRPDRAAEGADGRADPLARAAARRPAGHAARRTVVFLRPHRHDPGRINQPWRGSRCSH